MGNNCFGCEQRVDKEDEPQERTNDIELPLTALAKPYDVVISSTPSDEEISSFIKTQLEEASISCYYNSSESESEMMKRAMVDAKVLVFVASDEAAGSSICRDDLCLAHVSRIPIVAASIKSKDDLIEGFESGTKLILQGLSWATFADREAWETVGCDFVKLVQKTLSRPRVGSVPYIPMKARKTIISPPPPPPDVGRRTARGSVTDYDPADDTDLGSKNGKNTLEYRKLLKSSNILVRQLAAARCAGQLASQLQAKELISEPVYYTATSHGPGITELSQVQAMIDAMLLKVEGNSGNYSTFISILRDIHSDCAQLVEESESSR